MRARSAAATLSVVLAPVFFAAQTPRALEAQEPATTASAEELALQGWSAAEQTTSPDGRNVVTVGLREDGLFWAVERDGRAVLLPSRLGFDFRDAPDLRDGLRVVGATRETRDETWEQPWGQVRHVQDHHNELMVAVQETGRPGRAFQVVVRAFDDGVALRYHLPAQASLTDFAVQEELTEFNFAYNHKAWWVPSDQEMSDRSEMLYAQAPLSTLDSVQTPLTLESRTGDLYMVLHEAHLVDYPRMFLAGTQRESNLVKAALAPLADGAKAYGRTPFSTPWRYLQMADRVEELVPSVLGLNLNPPSVLDDTSWIEPMTYVGIWWGMHINTMTWGSGPLHGATTENARTYIDFAAENGIGGVLVEGWNTGWDGDWIANADLFSFTEPYPDYDLDAVAAYARERGVDLIAHNETSLGIDNYESQLDEAFNLYASLGIRTIKSGYVGDLLAGGHSHFSQEMVRHHRLVLEEAAERGIMMNVHEPVHDTGERRTYPNMMTREGSRGQEFSAWSGDGGNPPEHETILFFTRLIPGPMDYTPGIFDLLRTNPDGTTRAPWEPRIQTTLAKQLALYVVMYSPLQMAADLPENYEGQPGFQFIRNVAVDWEETRVLEGRIGDYVVVARKARDSDEWFVGAITDEEAREFQIELDFLDPGVDYTAEIYGDGDGAHWRDDPLPLSISERRVDRGSTLDITLAAGGGQAIRIRPSTEPSGT